VTSAIESPAGAGAGGHEGIVLALDLATGTVLWQTAIFAAPDVELHPLNTQATPTPVADGESVYAYFGSHLARLTRDGEVVWAREVDPAYGRFARYGAASSPVLVGDMVVVVQDQEEVHDADRGWMAAFDRETGEEVWRRTWDDTCCSYSTPLLWQRPDARPELLFAHSGRVVAYDPTNGEPLWRHGNDMWQLVGGLVAEGNVVCALGGAHTYKSNLCFRVTGEGASARVERLWTEPRRAPEIASALIYRGRLYAVTMLGVLSCYDPVSGKLHWWHRLEPGKAFRASLVAGDGKVYAVPSRGPAAVIDATTDSFHPLAWNDLGEPGLFATPAIGGGCLLLRTPDRLLCIGKEAPAP
jgi:outer membrane protein assembly factor BamB